MKSLYKSPITLFFLTMGIGIASCQASLPASTGNSALPKTPWSKTAINNSKTDAVYRQEWLKAESKSLCPIIALPKQASSHSAGHSVRRANFSGGWAVAYDLPNVRSAYGVANAGTVNPDDLTYEWPYNARYKDGSTVGYGHEGGNPDAKWLAYIVIPRNNCFYNVWSSQGKTHLEQIIADLRLVNP